LENPTNSNQTTTENVVSSVAKRTTGDTMSFDVQ
jgi:hypothetical protein